MAEHIYHATAVMAELGLAMAIGTITKIFPQPAAVDAIARETTQKRIAQSDGKIASFFYGLGCSISNWVGQLLRFVPAFVFIAEMSVLGGIAFSSPSAAIPLFAASFFGLIVMMFYIYFNRETFRKTGHEPAVEPVQ